MIMVMSLWYISMEINSSWLVNILMIGVYRQQI